MSYLVFARKYRPQSFDEVIGQEHVAKTLQNAIAGGRLAHAYLFAGPRGVGKTTMARILAKAVNCAGRGGGADRGAAGAADADAVEEMADAIMAGQDVDVLEIDAASNRKVDDVEPLIDSARYLPQRAPRKIFIVDEAHMLSKHAWNALLKTLEEPPPHVLFIFATTEPHKVIETVRSRCQRFDFRRITPADIARKLERIVEAEGLQVDPAVLAEIAGRSTGGLRDAETMLDQLMSAAPPDRALGVADLVTLLGDVPREVRLTILRHAHAGAMEDVLAAAGEIVDRAGADPAALLRDLFGDLHDEAVKSARGDGEAHFGVEWCLAAAELVGRHLELADRSRAPRATLDLGLLALARLGDVKDLEDLVVRLERLSGPGSSGGSASAPSPGSPASASSAPSTSATAPSAPSASSASSASEPASRRAPDPSEPPRAASGGKPDVRGQWKKARGAGGTSGASGTSGGAIKSRKAALETAAPAPENEDRSTRPVGGGAGDGSGGGLSSAELARIRNLPRVKEALTVFKGRIEDVRRNRENRENRENRDG